MTDILILGDVHAQPQDIVRQLELSKHMGYKPEAIIQVGDLGIWKDAIKKFPRLDIPLYYVLGNHEDYYAELMIEGLPKCYIHLEPDIITDICGLKTVGIDGSAYIDQFNTPVGSTIKYDHIKKCIKKRPDVDMIVTHDCPSDIGMRSNFFGSWDKTEAKWDYVGSELLEELLIDMKPKLWLFGHHHMDFTVYNNGCHFIGFEEANDGFGILDSEYKTVRFASSVIEK